MHCKNCFASFRSVGRGACRALIFFGATLKPLYGLLGSGGQCPQGGQTLLSKTVAQAALFSQKDQGSAGASPHREREERAAFTRNNSVQPPMNTDEH